MAVWSFYDFAVGQSSLVESELHSLVEESDFEDVKDRLDRILLKLRVMKVPWPKTFCKPYKLPKKATEKLFEIRVDHLNVEYRFLSCFGPTQRAFTLLTVGTERDFKLASNVVNTARSRTHLIGPWRNIREHKFNN